MTAGDPNLFSNQFHKVRQIPSNGVGCIADSSQHGAVGVHIDGQHWIYFPWYDGIWRLGENDAIEKISDDIQDTWDTRLNKARLANIEMGVDPSNRYLLAAVSRSGKTINDLLLRYDLIRKRWLKDDIHVSTFAQVEETTGHARLYFGDYWGFVNKLYDTNYDGTSTGTLKGRATSGSSKTFSFTTGGFTTAGQGLGRIPIMVSTGSGWERRIIQSNSPTVIQVYTGGGYSAFSTAPASTNRFWIAYIDGKFKTPKHAHGSIDTVKRHIYLSMVIERKTAGHLDVERFYNGAVTNARQKRVLITNREVERVPLYPDDSVVPVNNAAFSVEFMIRNHQVNQPFKVKALVYDAEVTDQVQE